MGNKIGNVPDVWTGCFYCSGKIIKHGFTKGNKQKYKAYYNRQIKMSKMAKRNVQKILT